MPFGRGRISRRLFLAGAPGLGVAIGLSGLVADVRPAASPASGPAQETIPFFGDHQPGITTPPQQRLHFAAFDLTTDRVQDVADLLRAWSFAAARMCAGERAAPDPDVAVVAPLDTGEALESGPARLTITFGIGPGAFARDGIDRFGLKRDRPAALADLPAFVTDHLDPGLCGGDLCVQACADDAQVAFHAIRNLASIGRGVVALRWMESGFRPPVAASDPTAVTRNLLGFKDGTNNIRADDDATLDHLVWAGEEGPSWMVGGSYLVVRRIRIRIESWDRNTLQNQNAVIGREKVSGAPLGGRTESETPNFEARSPDGTSAIPLDAHVRLARGASTGTTNLLRRSYSYAGGVDPSGQIDAGLFFICYQRDPRRQFVAIQQRLAGHDALDRYIVHTGSAIFACPPGAPIDGWVGRPLFNRTA